MPVVTDTTIIEAHAARATFPLRFSRRAAAVSTSYHHHSYWQSSGRGGQAGSVPAAGAANGRACSKTTAGALQFPNAPSGREWFLHVPILAGHDGPGAYNVFDKYADVQLSIAASSGAVTGCDATGRLASGDGCMLLAEVVTGLSAVANTFTITYINQDGVSKTTPNIVSAASATQCRSVSHVYMYLPLADGDMGVRSITSLDWVSGAGTGTILISLVKKIYAVGVSTRPLGLAHDLFFEYPAASFVPDNACLYFTRTNNTGATTMDHIGGALNLIGLPI